MSALPEPIMGQAVGPAPAANEVHYCARLPDFVKDEFDAFLECGILAHGFLRLRCAQCETEIIVVKGTDGEVSCCGAPMAPREG